MVQPNHGGLPVHKVLGVLFLGSLIAVACFDSPNFYEGMPDHVAKRHVLLEGAVNFRDLGGYLTEDGREVKWNLFYRSDNLHGLTDSDLEKVSELGIHLVCDFRGPNERKEEPDRLPENNPPDVAELEIWDESFSAEGFKEMLTSGESENINLGDILVEGNRLFAGKFSGQYATMFELITQPENLPVLVHCTAGKDRAGFASALILRVLGVPLETIYDDYLLTNYYSAEKIERAVLMIRAMSLFRTDEEQLRGVIGVERRFLEAAFTEIHKQYGSFESYRREALGIDDTQLFAFRKLALD